MLSGIKGALRRLLIKLSIKLVRRLYLTQGVIKMRAVIQRVKEAKVEVNGDIIGKIGEGFLVLLGVGKDDTEEDVRYLAYMVTAEKEDDHPLMKPHRLM